MARLTEGQLSRVHESTGILATALRDVAPHGCQILHSPARAARAETWAVWLATGKQSGAQGWGTTLTDAFVDALTKARAMPK